MHRPRSRLDRILICRVPNQGSKGGKHEYSGCHPHRKFCFDNHVDNICSRARQSLYALCVLAAHGLSGSSLHDVVRATTLTRMLYAAPAWWGLRRGGHAYRRCCGDWSGC